MQKLPHVLIHSIQETIAQHQNLVYYLDLYGFSFDLPQFINETYFEQFSTKNTTKNILDFQKKVYGFKRNWVQAQIKYVQTQNGSKSNADLYNGYQEICKLFQQQGEVDFYEITGYESPETWLAYQTEQLLHWQRVKQTLLVDFPYIDKKLDKTIILAIRRDVTMLILKYLLDNHYGNPQDIIMEQIDLPLPITSMRKGRRKKDLTVIENKERQYQRTTVIKMNGTLDFEHYVQEDYLMQHAYRRLTTADMETFNLVMSQRDEKVLFNRRIEFSLPEFTKRLYGEKRYHPNLTETVENQIIKLSNMFFNITNNNTGERIGFNFFDGYKISPNKTVVTITISNFLFDMLTKGHVLHIYRKELKALGSTVNFNLFLMLQKDRILHHIMGKGMQRTYTIDFLRRQYETRSTTKPLIDKELIQALTTLQKERLVIHTFDAKNYLYHVDFKPLTDYEIKDLIGSGYQKYNDVLSEQTLLQFDID